MNIVDFAEQILELAADRDQWRHRAINAEMALDKHTTHVQESIQGYENLLGNLLVVALDDNSGIHRAHRALERDPLKGAKQ